MREAPVEDGAEAAHDDGVGERGQQLGLALEVAQRGGIGRAIRAQDLRHEHRQTVLVPDQHRLVAAATADPAQHRASRGKLVAFLQAPRGPRAALPRWRCWPGCAAQTVVQPHLGIQRGDRMVHLHHEEPEGRADREQDGGQRGR